MSRSGSRSSDGHPTKIAGLYDLEETLGRGHYAVVKLARHVFTGEKVAVKVIDKTKLDPVSQDHLYQEVRCMKLVQHPNVVRLYEVIDTNSKLYLILELGDGGDLYDYIMKHDTGLSEAYAREYFAQIVRAISFCHKLHVVHRDLKPENVVFFERLGVVKLTDFGFSNRFNPGQKLETSCGSMAYSAPEILLGDSYDAPAVDVWSLGVILYMLVAGHAPFQEANDSETLTMIMDVKYRVPAHVTRECERLIGRMLVREPEKRATLEEIASDPWLSPALQDDQMATVPLVSRETVSEEDHSFIITKMVNGKIASKEDILEALDKDEYNHITATYYLLAERKLRLLRQPKKPPPSSAGSSSSHSVTGTLSQSSGGCLVPPLVSVDRCSDLDAQPGVSPARVNQALLSMSRHPGDVSIASRTRKCSIVTEEEDDEEEAGGSGVDARRGSRSEGKLNLTVAELRRESILMLGGDPAATVPGGALKSAPPTGPLACVTPLVAKTLPASLTSSIPSGLAPLASLDEEEGGPIGGAYGGAPRSNSAGFISGTSGVSGGKGAASRGALFRKARTGSVSSSEASDEDEARHSRRGSTKSLARRGSHEPPDRGGGGGGMGGAQNGGEPDRDNNSSNNNNNANPSADSHPSNNNTPGSNNSSSAGSSNHSNQSGGIHSNGDPSNGLASPEHAVARHAGSRHHKRRGGETRLRESQSLNRITEVTEVEAPVVSGGGGAEGVPPGGGDGGSRRGSICFRCCVEEMCSIEKSLCGGEQNNNSVLGEGEEKSRVEGEGVSEKVGEGERRDSVDNEEGMMERLANEEEDRGTVSPPASGLSVRSSVSYQTSSCSKNLTNVYSRNNNKHRYIHNSNTVGGGGGGLLTPPKGGVVKTNYLSSSISCNDLPDGCHGNVATVCSEESTGEPMCAIGKSSRKFNTITRIKNRHNKENSGYSDGKSKLDGLPSNGYSEGKSKADALPSNGTAGTNQNASCKTSTVVNKNKKSNKNTLINRYLYLQKKLVQPLFGGKKAAGLAIKEGRLYKAKSCSEVEKTSCATGPVKYNVLSKNQASSMQRCSKHVRECTAPLKVTASIVNIDHRTSTVI